MHLGVETSVFFFLLLRLAGFLFVGMRKGRCPEKEKEKKGTALGVEDGGLSSDSAQTVTHVSSLRVIVKEPSRF